MKNADFDKMGTDLAKFFFLPKFFGVFGPLIGAALVYFIGFWPTFLIAMTGVVLSYLPLVRIDTSGVQVTFHWSDAIAGLRRRKGLFVLECLENLLEESAWFWGIYVFLILGSLEVPGIAGALSAIGAAFFTLFVGKKVNASPRQFVVISALGLSLVFLSQVFARGALDAYIISLVSSFVFSAFMVAYSSVIYREVKGNEEEEFVILREVPVVLGRFIGFIAIILFATHPRAYFFLPMAVALMLAVQFLLRGTLGVSLKHS